VERECATVRLCDALQGTVANARVAERDRRRGARQQRAGSLQGGGRADLLQLARVRILRFLKRQGVIVETRPLEVSDANPTDAESLQQLAAAAVTGQAPAGPEL
jgi:hypothetical protein